MQPVTMVIYVTIRFVLFTAPQDARNC